MERPILELGEDLRPTPTGSPYDYDWKGGRALELKLNIQGVRDLHAATVQLARVLTDNPKLRQAVLAVRIPSISSDRLRKEWASVKSLLRPTLASKLALISVGGKQPWTDPAEPELEKLAAALYSQVSGTERQTSISRQAITPKFFEIFKILLNHWLRNRAPMRVAEIIAQSGSSYPTVAEAVDHLIDTHEVVRETNRRVEMNAFPRKTWGEILALSLSLRKTIYFADTSGRPSEPQGLLRRIGTPVGIAAGGVVAARHWDSTFDLHGMPRLDLSIHAPRHVFGLDVFTRADPALSIVGSRSPNIVFALHPLHRKEALFEASAKNALPVVDPVETLLDLHELGLTTQAEELLGRLTEKGGALIELDPKKLFRRLAGEIPKSLHRHVLIVGSLAAAYHYRAQLKTRAVNTKDADLIVHPAGDVGSCRKIAERLLRQGWTRIDKCYSTPRPKPTKDLRVIRLNPPKSRDYFVEILGLPKKTQKDPVVWAPVQLSDGWYVIGCYRFMAVSSLGRLRSAEGLEYASPSAMALANLLAHPRLGEMRMSDPIGGQSILRSAKDLGRVLALAWLEGREGTAEWVTDWRRMLQGCYPSKWRTLAKGVGSGLRSLLENRVVLEEARITTEVGLLNRLNVTSEMLRVTGERLIADVIPNLAEG